MKIFTNEKLFTRLLFVLALAGLAMFTWKTWHDALPYTRGDSSKLFTEVQDKSFYEKIAVSFLNENAIDVGQKMLATSVTTDPLADAFLQQNVGKMEAYDYLKKYKLENSTYTVRFFQEMEKKEIFVNVKPNSTEVLGFGEVLRENETRKNVDKVEAQNLVEAFILSQRIGTTTLELKDYSESTIQKRTDHYFTYVVKGSEIATKYGDGYVMLTVSVLGDKVGGYGKLLFVPEDFSREMSSVMSIGELLAFLSFIITILVAICAFIIIVQAFMAGKVTWKPFVFLFLSIFAVSFFDLLNNFDQLIYSYPTDMYLSIFLWSTSLSGLFYGSMFTCLIVLAGTAGYYLDKTTFHRKLSNLHDYKASVVRGYFIAFISLGISALLYFLAEKYLGLWTYGVVENYSIHLSLIPIISGIYLTLSSSVAEEVIYRYFGFLFVRKYLKSVFIAALLVTLVWAVGHSNYPVFPVYFRGVELLIGGLVWMYFVLRYNVLTTVVAHFVFNATLFAVPLLLTVGFVNIASGFLLILFPFVTLVAYDAYLKFTKTR